MICNWPAKLLKKKHPKDGSQNSAPIFWVVYGTGFPARYQISAERDSLQFPNYAGTGPRVVISDFVHGSLHRFKNVQNVANSKEKFHPGRENRILISMG